MTMVPYPGGLRHSQQNADRNTRSWKGRYPRGYPTTTSSDQNRQPLIAGYLESSTRI